MPSEVVEIAKQLGAKTGKADTVEEVIADADVIYVTRIQRERFPDPAEYEKVAGLYKITSSLLEKAKKSAIVMHPLPRVKEISSDVDATSFAAYFKQAFYGVPTRMALIGLVTGVLE
jgi:aspartate carbamoyltransferase catalytic subunit